MADPMGLFDLVGRVVVVTGASSGIGADAARCFAACGANVVLAARRVDRIEALAKELPGSLAVATDVTDEASCAELLDATIGAYGRIDVLVNNAGAFSVEPAEKEPAEVFRNVVETNLVATFLLSRLAAEHMFEAGRGSIVNMASIFGLVGCGAFPQTSYAASKGGIVNLTRELAVQWATRGVRVNAIAPAFFETEMTQGTWDDTVGWIRRRTPMGRPGELAELHGALIFLASDASSYVTGTTLPVDGGWTAI
jgi:NAD(P)-dependent dehydrogenase (short-subunit alcohol dehydrogenase family)